MVIMAFARLLWVVVKKLICSCYNGLVVARYCYAVALVLCVSCLMKLLCCG